jgi:hypothetical protein
MAKTKPAAPAKLTAARLRELLEEVKGELDPFGRYGLEDVGDLARELKEDLHDAKEDLDAAKAKAKVDQDLMDAVEAVEGAYRRGALNAIRGERGEHPLFTELWRAAGVARNGL